MNHPDYWPDPHYRAIEEQVRRHEVAEALEYLRQDIDALLRRVKELENRVIAKPEFRIYGIWTDSEYSTITDPAQAEKHKRYREALELVLLFYTAPWTPETSERWAQITTNEATSRGMCDHIRAVLNEKGDG